MDNFETAIQRLKPTKVVHLYEGEKVAEVFRDIHPFAISAPPYRQSDGDGSDRTSGCHTESTTGGVYVSATPTENEVHAAPVTTAVLRWETSAAFGMTPDASERGMMPDASEHGMPDASEHETNPTVSMTCTMCRLHFLTREEQKLHFKSDYHHFNLKQKIRGLEQVDEEAFAHMTGDMSSLSGSDSSSSSDDSDSGSKDVKSTEDGSDDGCTYRASASVGSQRLYFQNGSGDIIAVYKAVLCSRKSAAPTAKELQSLVEALPVQNTWILLMIGGGHFAGAVFENGKVILHKTYHRYVVRAKRGTSQGAHDEKGNAPKSAGASLRRHNELALTKDIRELLSSWSPHFAKCHRIFIRVAGRNRRIFFDDENPSSSLLHSNDPRIRVIPVATRRATFTEVQRVFLLLSSVYCYQTTGHVQIVLQQAEQEAKSLVQRKLLLGSQKNASHTSKKVDTSIKPASSDKWRPPSSECSSVDDVSLLLDGAVLTASAEQLCGTQEQKEFLDSHQHRQVEGQHDRASVHKTDFLSGSPVNTELFTACKAGDAGSLAAILTKFSRTQVIAGTGTAAVFAPRQETPILLSQSVVTSAVLAARQETPVLQSQSVVSLLPAAAEVHIPELSAMLNQPVVDSSGPCHLLHIAAQAGHCSIVRLLLEHGADPVLRNYQGKTPYQVCVEKEARNEFRRFMARHPDAFDYASSQIPGPLTEQMESERKEKELIRRKAQKKIKKEGMKAKKADERILKQEDQERERFVQLSDREKRALAADQRLVKQLTDAGEKNLPALSRCWRCGSNMTGQVPFEYFNYKFCSTACLKVHRTNSQKSTEQTKK